MIISIEVEGITDKVADDIARDVIEFVISDLGFQVVDYRVEDA